jgi:hypothetical protein
MRMIVPSIYDGIADAVISSIAAMQKDARRLEGF